jgi:hypothetical protein
MHAVIRSYSGHGAGALFDVLEQRKDEVQQMMQAIPGFVSYSLIRTGDGGSTVTICDDKAGTDESLRRAREWVDGNVAQVGAPQISEGPVILHVG